MLIALACFMHDKQNDYIQRFTALNCPNVKSCLKFISDQMCQGIETSSVLAFF